MRTIPRLSSTNPVSTNFILRKSQQRKPSRRGCRRNSCVAMKESRPFDGRKVEGKLKEKPDRGEPQSLALCGLPLFGRIFINQSTIKE